MLSAAPQNNSLVIIILCVTDFEWDTSIQQTEKNVKAYLEDVVVEEPLHYPLALQLSLEEENQQQFLTSDEGGLPHQLPVASGLEPLCSEMQSQGLRTLASCLREKGLAGYLVLDLVL